MSMSLTSERIGIECKMDVVLKRLTPKSNSPTMQWKLRYVLKMHAVIKASLTVQMISRNF